MNRSRTIWNYSVDTETERVAYTLVTTVNRFNSLHGFYVLPFLVRRNPDAVHLPEIRLPKNCLYRLGRLQPTIPLKLEQTDFEIIKKQLIHRLMPIADGEISLVKKRWLKVESRFRAAIEPLFMRKPRQTLEIRPTVYGTMCSFDIDSQRIFVYYRIDMDISHIAEAVVSSLFYHRLNRQYGNRWMADNWREKEAAVDNIMTVGPLAELFPKYIPTVTKKKIAVNRKLSQASKKHLREFGITEEPVFAVSEDRVTLLGKSINNLLSPCEKQILACLIKKNGQIVSFENIGQIIWSDVADEKYSLWAMAKTIQRLREKISRMGIQEDIILTKRKQGYLLQDNPY